MAKLGRFEVMALLQAARYYTLTNDRDMAYSFGLNRAIFYAWAKRRARIKPPPKRRIKITAPIEKVKEEKSGKTLVYLGDEGAYISQNGWFTIGGKEQKPEDFEERIARKIEMAISFEEAWKFALEYVQTFGEETLLDQRKFYEKVYKPVRDKFLEAMRERKTRKREEKPKKMRQTTLF